MPVLSPADGSEGWSGSASGDDEDELDAAFTATKAAGKAGAPAKKASHTADGQITDLETEAPAPEEQSAAAEGEAAKPRARGRPKKSSAAGTAAAAEKAQAPMTSTRASKRSAGINDRI